ncbi:uncharacterized protein TNCV_884441 [Trichonephila clavipes]|nr:uncharacterized protein TNCV_884441 [Trichonephila clavipes]
MDEILTTARDLELEMNEDAIEELIMGHEDELTTEELTKCLLWFGWRHVDNFVHTEKVDISKLGVSSSFQANYHYSLHTGYLEKIKKKGTFFFCRYKRHVGASMDGNGASPRYFPCHEGHPY